MTQNDNQQAEWHAQAPVEEQTAHPRPPSREEGKKDFVPYLISWNLTQRCNLRCKHCYINASTAMPGELSTDEALRVLDGIAEVGPGALLILSGGEPLLRPDLDVLVAGDVDDALVSATDRIIADFCKEFGDVETAMPIVKHQFTKAGVDVKEPTKDALLRALHALAEIEHGYKSDERVSENLTRRSGWVRKAN